MNIHVVQNGKKSVRRYRLHVRNDDEMKRLKEAYESLDTLVTVACRFGVREQTIRELARSNGWVRPEKPQRNGLTVKAVKAMLDEGFKQKEIAEHYGIGTTAVSRFVQKHFKKTARRTVERVHKAIVKKEMLPPVASPEPFSAKPGTVIWTTESNRHVTLPAVSFIAGVDRRTG